MSIRSLHPKLVEIAKKDLHEDPQRTEKDIQQVKVWISQQPFLKARTDDQWLVAFLRGCKFSLERVKKKIDLYYTLRTTASDITRRFASDESRLLEVLKLGVCLVLPKSSEVSDPRVVLFRPGAYDTEKYNVLDLIGLFYQLVQILVLEDDTATVVGVKILVDYSDITLSHLSQSQPTLLKKIIVVIQESIPLRLKGSHHINLPSSVETVLNLVKTLVSEKAKNRLKVHKTTDDLISNLPKESIPSEYGGAGGTIPQIIDSLVTQVTQYQGWLRQDQAFGTDESRRPGKPVTADELFGIQGSFRKLDLD